MEQKISVVVPVYNHAKRLNESLFSVFKQTYRPLETIVVNDGSTDDFIEEMAKISNSDWGKTLNIKVVNQENRGAPAARNRGMSEATGEYVIFWDADTVGRPDMLQQMHDALQKHPEASYAYSRFKFGWKTFRSQEFDGNKLKEINYIDTTSLIRKKDLLSFDESLKRFQDWDLWLTMLEKKRTGVFVAKVLYNKIVVGRKGISSWRPKFVYRLPFKTKSVKEYEEARRLVLRKHGLLPEGK